MMEVVEEKEKQEQEQKIELTKEMLTEIVNIYMQKLYDREQEAKEKSQIFERIGKGYARGYLNGIGDAYTILKEQIETRIEKEKVRIEKEKEEEMRKQRIREVISDVMEYFDRIERGEIAEQEIEEQVDMDAIGRDIKEAHIEDVENAQKQIRDRIGGRINDEEYMAVFGEMCALENEINAKISRGDEVPQQMMERYKELQQTMERYKELKAKVEEMEEEAEKHGMFFECGEGDSTDDGAI